VSAASSSTALDPLGGQNETNVAEAIHAVFMVAFGFIAHTTQPFFDYYNYRIFCTNFLSRFER